MDAARIKDLAELVDHDRHLIAALQEQSYSEEELMKLRRFLNSCFGTPPADRQETVRRWMRYLPARGDAGLVKVIQSMWDDGHDGKFFARVLDKQ